jgi:hypothetical protein
MHSPGSNRRARDGALELGSEKVRRRGVEELDANISQELERRISRPRRLELAVVL